MKYVPSQSTKKEWRTTDLFRSRLAQVSSSLFCGRRLVPTPSFINTKETGVCCDQALHISLKGKKQQNLGDGFTLVEVVLATASLALFVTIFVGAFLYGEEGTVLAGARARAVFLAEEGQEAVQNMRDQAFSNLTNGTFGLATSSNQWVFSGTQDTTDIFTRQVTVSTIDANQKNVATNISWQQNPQRTGAVSLSSKFSNWARAATGNWAIPSLQYTYNVNSSDTTLNGSAIAVAGNFAYVGRVNGVGNEFFVFSISTSSAPVLLGQRDLGGTPNGIVVSGNYAYIASASTTAELQIVDISNPATIANAGKLTTVDLTVANSGNATAAGLSVKVQGNYLYMARATGGNTFLIFDIGTSPANPGNPIGRISTVTTPNDLAVSGNYAYLSSTDNAAELQVVDITTKTAPVRVTAFDLNSGSANADALSVDVLGQNVIVGRAASAAPEIYMISVANPLSPVLLSTLEVGSNVLNSATDPNLGYAFFVTANTAADFLVVDAIDPAAIVSLGTVNLNNGPINIKYSTSLDRAVIVGTFDTEELQIVRSQ